MAGFHLILHALVPAGAAWFFYKKERRRAFLIMMAGMAIDIDHLLAEPIYDPQRCGIGFHPLHSGPAIFLYAALLLHRRTRLAGLGVVIHIALDALDCLRL